MINYQGTALITGASSGIGAVFAHQLAARGMNLVLVARSQDKLNALASELTQRHRVQADVICVDLSKADSAETLFRETEARNINITLLVNNAGFATCGSFQTLALACEQEQIMLNVYALVGLTRLYLPELLSHPGSAIINVASTAAFQPLPYMAVYAASKAFVLSFSAALSAELKGTNVSTLAFCPGPVKTGFLAVMGATEAIIGKQDTPEFVVHKALAALDSGKYFVIPRFDQNLLAYLVRILPGQLVLSVSKKLLQPRKILPQNTVESIKK